MMGNFTNYMYSIILAARSEGGENEARFEQKNRSARNSN